MFKPVLVSGITCPKCGKSDNIHPHGSKFHGGKHKKYFRCGSCSFIFVDPALREKQPKNIVTEACKDGSGSRLPIVESRISTKIRNLPHSVGVKHASSQTFEQITPPIPIKKPLPSVDSIKDCPCFRKCINSFKPCDPASCKLLDEWLGLRNFPLMVIQ